jgi:PleD family two-component response regulator
MHPVRITPGTEQNDDKIIVPYEVVKRMILTSPVRLQAVSSHLQESFHGIRVLVVDDSKLNRKFMIRLLAIYNFIITEAEDGLDCLEKYKADLNSPSSPKISVILMDVSTHSFT